MNNNIQCSIESSTTKIELNSAVDGVFLVPELEGLAGLPEIRTTSGVNAGYDGGWTSAQNYDARLISIRGVIANPDISKVEDKRRAIASLLGQGRKEQLTLRFTTEAGNAYAISVRTISCEMALQRVLTTQEFLIQLRADDPLIYDDGATGGIAAILQPQRALGGFEINFDLPLAIGGGAEDTVVDNGNETVYPVIKMYGALHSPTVVNRTTNQQMQILADLQYSIDWHTYRSATGDYILVNDGLNGAPMTLSQLLGNAEQTTYSGKNLLNDTTAQRTIPSSGSFNATIPITIGAGTYSFGAFADGVFCPEANYYVFQFRNGSTPIVQSSTPPTPMTLTAQEASQVDNMFLYFNANFTGRYGGKHLTAMVCSGSTLGNYEPYVGGIPSPNPDYPQDVNVVTGAQTVVVTGKNLLDTSDPHDKSGSGMTATWNNGVVEVKGTNTATSFPLSDNITLPTQIKAGTEISVSFAGASVGNTLFRFYNQATSQYEALTVASPNTSGTYTLTRDADAVQLYKGGVPTNTYKEFSISNWQIEYGSTATTYEPYQNQSYEVNLGKNLLDINSLATTGVTVADGVMTATATDIYNAYGQNTTGMPFIKKDGQLSVSLKAYTDGNVSTTNNEGIRIRVTYTDGTNGTLLSFNNNQTTATAKSATTTAGKNVEYIQITYVNTGGNTWHISELQIEQGATPTSYAPYFTPIELAKIGTYQDRIYKDDGKWYIEKQVGKVVFDGSQALTLRNTSGNGTYTYSMNSPFDYKVEQTTRALSDHFTYLGIAGGVADMYNANKLLDKLGIALYYNSSYPTSSAVYFNSNVQLPTWLTSHPTTVYYALATPTTTEITDEALLLQLNFLASLYGGVNNISLVGTGAQGEMVISYATDYTVNQDVITIDSQARTITLNGQDVYHLKTSESEFLVLAPGENKLYLTSEVSDDSGYAEVKFKQGYLSI